MASKKSGMDDLDLDLGGIDFNFDPVEDKRSPILKVSTSFSKSLTRDLKSLSLLKQVALGALPTEYGKVLKTYSDVSAASKKLWKDAVTEVRPLMPDVKRAVAKILPRASTVLPETVRKKLDDFSKSTGSGGYQRPSDESRQDAEIGSTLGQIFGVQMQHQAEVKAQDHAYSQIRNQISDDQFRMGFAQNSVMAQGIQRLVAYQDQVASQYQRKSLELQYRQLFVAREHLRITATTAADSLTLLRGIQHRTGLPDFAKSSEFGKIENNAAKRLARSIFPQSQRFMDQYFANFTNAMGNRVRENLTGFIDAYRGAGDIAGGMQGVDKSHAAGQTLGKMAAHLVGGQMGKLAKKHLSASKMIKKFGSKYSYLLGNLPDRMNRFAQSKEDYSELRDAAGKKVHGRVMGHLMNFFRDVFPQVGDGTDKVGRNAFEGLEDHVPFNRQARMSLTEVIPGYLSRIHHELLIMRTGNPKVARQSWNPVKGTFTTAKASAVDIHKTVVKKDEVEKLHRNANVFLDKIDSSKTLSAQARAGIKKQLILDGLNGRSLQPSDYFGLAGKHGISPAAAKEIETLFQGHFGVDAHGQLKKTGRYGRDANWENLNAASTAHAEALRSVVSIKGRIQDRIDAGYGEELRNMGATEEDAEGNTILHRRHMLRMLNGATAKSPRYRESGFDATMAAAGMGGMHQVASGGAPSHPSAVSAAVASMIPPSGDVFKELSEGKLIQESRKHTQTLTEILQAIEMQSHVSGNAAGPTPGGGSAASSGPSVHNAAGPTPGGGSAASSGPSVHIAANGTAWIKNKLGQLRKLSPAAAAKHAQQHAAKMGSGLGNAYRNYMGKPPTGFIGHAGHFVGGGLGMIGSAAGLGASALGSYLRLSGKLTGAALRGVGHVASGGIGMLGGIAHGIGGMFHGGQKYGYRASKRALTGVMDVYVSRSKMPVLVGELMAQGRYLDAWDNKPILKVEDIHGAVKDTVTGQIVLTADDYAGGLYNSSARKIGRGVAGGLLGMAKWAGKFAMASVNLSLAPARIAIGAIKGVFNLGKTVKRWATHDTDIYVGGEKLPRLYGTRMAQGLYVCMTTGKDVHKASDIVGPVQDKETKQVKIEEVDLGRGIYNAFGHNLTKGIFAAWGVAKTLIKLPFAVAGLAWKATKIVGGAAASLIGGGLGGLARHLGGGGKSNTGDAQSLKLLRLQVDTQKGIFKLLHQRMPIPKKHRAGDWENKLMGIESEEQADKAGGKMQNAPGRGIFGKIAGLFGAGDPNDPNHPPADNDHSTATAVKTAAATSAAAVLAAARKKAWQAAMRVKNWKRISQIKASVKAGTATAEDLAELSKLRGVASTVTTVASDASKVATPMAEAVKHSGGVWKFILKHPKAALALGLGAGAGYFMNKGSSPATADGEPAAESETMQNLGKLNDATDAAQNADTASSVARGAGWLGSKVGLGTGLKTLAKRAGAPIAAITAGYDEYGDSKAAGKSTFESATRATGAGAGAGVGFVAGAEAGAALGGVIGTAVPIVGNAVGVVVGGLIGGAIGAWGGSKIGAAQAGFSFDAWRWYNNRGPHYLMNVRLAQYGIEKGNSKQVEKVLKLESVLTPHIEFSGGEAKVNPKDLKPEDILAEFGVKISDKAAVAQWVAWYTRRFCPVFLNSVRLLKNIAKSVDLGNADKDLTPTHKREFLLALWKIPRGIYQVAANPFSGQSSWLFWKVGTVNVGTQAVDAAFDEAFVAVKDEIAKNPGQTETSVDKAAKPAGPVGSGGALNALLGKTLGTTVSDALDKISKAAAGPKGVAGMDALSSKAAAIKTLSAGVVKLMAWVPTPKSFDGNTLTSNEAIRFRLYGLTELKHDKVTALHDLELKVLENISVNAKGEATFSSDPQYFFNDHSAAFGIVNTDMAMRKNWLGWFQVRFLPVLLQYVSAVKVINPHVKPAEADNFLLPPQQLQVAKMMVGTKTGKQYKDLSVWIVATSPWADYKLNTNAKSVQGNLDYLQQLVDKMTYDEKTVVAGALNVLGLGPKPADAPKPAATAPTAKAAATTAAATSKETVAAATKSSVVTTANGSKVTIVNGRPVASSATGEAAATMGDAPTAGKTGANGIDPDKLCAFVQGHAGAKSQGHCAKFVRMGLEAAGANTKNHPVGAKDYGPLLLRNGFSVVDGVQTQKNDIVVWPAVPGHPYGHIMVDIGGGCYGSDFIQKHFLPASAYNGCTPTVYRLASSSAAGATTSTSAVASASNTASSGGITGMPGGAGYASSTGSDKDVGPAKVRGAANDASYSGSSSTGQSAMSSTANRSAAGGGAAIKLQPFTGSKKEFYDKAYTTLLESGKRQGVPNPEAIARVGAAQASLESGYGKHAPGNNFFGIKGSSGGKQTTQEFVNGRMVTIKDSFRGYGSFQESADDYIKFLKTNRHYKGVLAAKTAEEAIVAQGHSGYATDPNYLTKLQSIHGASGAGGGSTSNDMASSEKASPASGSMPMPAGATAATAGAPASGRTIAATPTPSIDRSPVGAANDDSASSNSRMQSQRTATAADSVARQSTASDNVASAKTADILAQSRDLHGSMDTTLKAMYAELQKLTAASGAGAGGSPVASSTSPNSQPSSQVSPPVVDVSRKSA